jgi:hypothetical protein
MEEINDRVRVLRMPGGGRNFLAKEYLVRRLGEWEGRVLSAGKQHRQKYQFFPSCFRPYSEHARSHLVESGQTLLFFGRGEDLLSGLAG